jgi:predicted HicB family RNase H-like nuclease
MDSEDRQVHVRLSPRLLNAIDERSKRYKMSRNAWIVRALQRTVDMPTQVTTKQERF